MTNFSDEIFDHQPPVGGSSPFRFLVHTSSPCPIPNWGRYIRLHGASSWNNPGTHATKYDTLTPQTLHILDGVRRYNGARLRNSPETILQGLHHRRRHQQNRFRHSRCEHDWIRRQSGGECSVVAWKRAVQIKIFNSGGWKLVEPVRGHVQHRERYNKWHSHPRFPGRFHGTPHVWHHSFRTREAVLRCSRHWNNASE